MNAKRVVLTFAVTIAMIAPLLLVVGAFGGPATYHGTHLAPPLPPADFTLRSADGPVSLGDLRGQVVPMFFGFTSCPDICPTTLLRLNTALDALEGGREDVQVLFVSVDPERDTPERTGAYARAVHPSFLGVTGSEEEIRDVASRYGIHHAHSGGSDATGYMVDHTAHVVVLNRKGERELLWSQTVTASQMAEDLAALLGR